MNNTNGVSDMREALERIAKYPATRGEELSIETAREIARAALVAQAQQQVDSDPYMNVFGISSQVQQPTEPSADHVICPACTHSFRAIPENVQSLLSSAGFEPPFLPPAPEGGE